MPDHGMILNHINEIVGQDMYAWRVLSLANATYGVIESGALAIHAIGNGLSWPGGLIASMQSNKSIVCSLIPDSMCGAFSKYVVGERTDIVVSMDWSGFDADDHCALVTSLQTSHRRSTP